MTTDKDSQKMWNHGHGGNAVYGLGLIGALIYFIQHASGAEQTIMGILKAIVWPAILVYRALGFWGF